MYLADAMDLAMPWVRPMVVFPAVATVVVTPTPPQPKVASQRKRSKKFVPFKGIMSLKDFLLKDCSPLYVSSVEPRPFITKVAEFGPTTVVTICLHNAVTQREDQIGQFVFTTDGPMVVLPQKLGAVPKEKYPDWLTNILMKFENYINQVLAKGATPFDCLPAQNEIKNFFATGRETTDPRREPIMVQY